MRSDAGEALVKVGRAAGVLGAGALMVLGSAASGADGHAPWPFGPGNPVAVAVRATAEVERGHAAMDVPWPFGNGDPVAGPGGSVPARPAPEGAWVVRFVGLPGVVAPVVLPAGSGAVAMLREGREPWLATAR